MPEDGSAKSSALQAFAYYCKTDGQGIYSIPELASGMYNVFVEKDGLVAFQDSVFISAANREIPIDTLRIPGSIVGKILIQPIHDAREFLIQLIGTPFHTYPNLDGGFTLKSLPKGAYLVRVSSMRQDYRTSIFSIRVRPGITDSLIKPFAPVFTSIPVVTGVKVSLDTLNGVVKVSWHGSDFSRLGYYVVERNDKYFRYGGPALVDGKDTSFLDTLFPSHGPWVDSDFVFTDSALFTLAYRVYIQDKSNTMGPVFENPSLQVPLPSAVVTRIEFPFDSANGWYVPAGGLGRIKVRFRNPNRKLVRVEWFDAAGKRLQTKNLHTNADEDSLSFQAPAKASVEKFVVKIEDDGGILWEDSVTIPVVSWRRLADRPLLEYNRAGKFQTDMPIATLDGKLYVFGSRGVEGHGSLDAFDPVTGKWEAKAEAPFLGTTLVVNGMIYMACGDSLQAYDPGKDNWERKHPFSIGQMDFYPANAIVIGDSIVALGSGNSSSTYYPQVYYPSRDQSQSVADYNYSIGAAGSRNLFSIKGQTYWTESGYIYTYNQIEQRSFNFCVPHPFQNYQKIDEINGFHFFILGGGLMDVYDEDRQDWTTKTAPFVPISPFEYPMSNNGIPGDTYHVIDGRLYFLSQTQADKVTVQVYDQGRDQWSIATLIQTRGNRFAASVVNGKLYVVSYYDKDSVQGDEMPALYEYPPAP